jgi:predicted  nucleic acid-binding Zn-ribbon protein
MTKYLRRYGTSAYSFQIDVHLTKVEFSVPFPCRLSVVFRRGNTKKETNSAALVEKSQASFDEILSVPATFYYDIRKKLFIEKEATLALQTVTNRGTKIAGITKFDLAEYANNNVKEKSVTLPVNKCIDKHAKFHFTIRVLQIEEIGHVPDLEFLKDDSMLQRKNFDDTLTTVVDVSDSILYEKPRFASPIKADLPERFDSPKGTFKEGDFIMAEFNRPVPVGVHAYNKQAPRMSEELPDLKYRGNLLSAKIGDTLRLNDKSLNKSRDDSREMIRSSRIVQKTPDREKNKLNYTMDTTTSKGSDDIQYFHRKLVDLEEQLKLTMSEKCDLQIRLQKAEEDLQFMNTEYQNLFKDHETLEKQHETLKSERRSCGDKRMELELKLYKEKVNSIMKLNDKLKKDLAAAQVSGQEMQKINDDLLVKMDKTGSGSNHASEAMTSFVTNEELEKMIPDLNLKLREYEENNKKLSQQLDQVIVENARLKAHFKPGNKTFSPSMRRLDSEIMMAGEKTPVINVFRPSHMGKSNQKPPTDRSSEGDEEEDGQSIATEEPIELLSPSGGRGSVETDQTPKFDRASDISCTPHRLSQTPNLIKSELDWYQKKLDELQNEVGRLNESLREKDNRIKDLLDKPEGKTEEIAKYEKLVQKYDTVKQQLTTLESQIKEKDENVITLLKNIEEKEKHISNLEESLSDNRMVLRNSLGNATTNTEEVKSLRQQLASMEDQKESIIQEHRKEIARYISELADMKSNLTKSNQEILQTEAKGEAEIIALKSENKKCKIQVQYLQEANKNCTCSSNQTKDLKEKLDIVLPKLHKFEEDNKVLQLKVAKLVPERDELRSQVAEKDLRVQALAADLAIVESETWKTKHSLAKMLNAAFEFGGSEFLDIIEKHMIADSGSS